MTAIEYDENTSTPFAFTSCAAMAFDRIASEAGAVLMQPIMKVQVSAPSEYIGDVISSITQRGGIVLSMESRTAADMVTAECPLENSGQRFFQHGILALRREDYVKPRSSSILTGEKSPVFYCNNANV